MHLESMCFGYWFWRLPLRLGVRPSNRRDGHIASCCAPKMSVAGLGDGRIGILREPEFDNGSRFAIRRRGDTA
jgi:hypothetical protein